MAFQIPEGLSDLLQDFTVSVLRESPCDLVLFASTYFNNLLDSRNKANKNLVKKGISFGSTASDDEQMQTDDSDEPMEEPPKSRFNLARRKSVAAERYDPEADEDGEKVIYPKSDDQRHRLNDAVRNILLFRSLDVEQMHEVIDAMFERNVQPGEHVIDQGQDGDNFYVIDRGTYDIHVNTDSGDKKVGSYDTSGSFGELALMYNMPRAATIIATSTGTLWAMDRATFRRIVLKNAFNKRKMYEQLLESVPMLKHLEPYERMNVADALVSKSFETNELIIQQGDTADCMYFVEDGQVRIMIKQKEEADEVFVSTVEKGNYFGELALVTHKPRAASAYAVGKTKCAVLDVQAFERLLGPCMKLMQRNIEDYEMQLVQIFGDKANISDCR